MNIVSVVFIWFGSALLFTFALCWAARETIPQPGDSERLRGSGDSGAESCAPLLGLKP